MNRRPHWLVLTTTTLVLCLSFTLNAFSIGIDSTFGNAGKLFISLSDSTTGEPTARATRLFVQPSGRIVVAGWYRQFASANFYVAGLGIAGVTSGGSLDTTFGTGGKIFRWNPAVPEYLRDVNMLSDGSLLVLSQLSPTPSTSETRLVKFTPNGQPDAGFNANIVGTPGQSYPYVIAPGSGGTIYVIVRNYSYEFTIFRLNADGSPDQTFGPSGSRTLSLNRFNRADVTKVVETEGGKLLLVGSYYDTTYQQIAFVIRLDSDTNLDRSFGLLGTGRIAIPGGGVYPSAIKILPNGKILMGGSWVFLGSNTMLTRLTFRGRLDYTFGTGAIVMHSYMALNSIGSFDVDANGNIFAVGGAGEKAVPPQGDSRFLVAKFSPTGTRESYLLSTFTPMRDAGLADMVLLPDGKILAAGYSENDADSNSKMAVARFLP